MPARSGYTPARRRGSARDVRRGARTPHDRRGTPPSSFRALREPHRRRSPSAGPRSGRWHRRRRRSRGRGEYSAPAPRRRPRRGQRRRSSYRQPHSRRTTRYSARAHRDRRSSVRDAPRASLEWSLALLSTQRPPRRMTADDARGPGQRDLSDPDTRTRQPRVRTAIEAAAARPTTPKTAPCPSEEGTAQRWLANAEANHSRAILRRRAAAHRPGAGAEAAKE